jgi:hypothetical protein
MLSHVFNRSSTCAAVLLSLLGVIADSSPAGFAFVTSPGSSGHVIERIYAPKGSNMYGWHCLTINAAFLLGQSAAVLTCSLRQFGATYLSSMVYFRLVTATVALALLA